MSRYFVNDPPVPVYEFNPSEVVSDTPPNVIWIKARMDVATQAKVTSELFTMDKTSKDLEARLGENQVALLVHNIVKWEGPDLSAIPCTPDVIRTLDPNEPHIAAVLEEIAQRNKKRESPKKESATTAGSTSAGVAHSSGKTREISGDTESVSLQLATGKSNSTLQRSLAGHLAKSENSTPIS